MLKYPYQMNLIYYPKVNNGNYVRWQVKNITHNVLRIYEVRLNEISNYKKNACRRILYIRCYKLI